MVSLLQTGRFVVVRFIARSEINELNSENSFNLAFSRCSCNSKFHDKDKLAFPSQICYHI